MSRKIKEKKTNVFNQFDGDNVPEDFVLPSIGIEDIDRAVFNLFENILDIQVVTKGETKKVPVIFGTGERFALTRRKQPLRDRNNANILPLISVVRKDIDISASQSNKKTAIAYRPQTSYSVKYRLNEKDRNYQNIINKSGLLNQDNVSSNKHYIDNTQNSAIEPDTIATKRNSIQFSKSASINLFPQIKNNIYEIIQTPYPNFVSMTYDVSFWVQYVSQGNQMIEYLLNKLRYPGNEILIFTESGYELMAFLSNSITYSNNFDNMTEEERLIKHNFTLTVPGYLINNDSPNSVNKLRSFYSAPFIDFSYNTITSNLGSDSHKDTKKEIVEKHVLTEVTSENEYEIMEGSKKDVQEVFVKNPFVDESHNEFLRVKNIKTRVSEQVISSRIIKEIDRQRE